MSKVYRVLRRKYAGNPFDGEGAYRYGGRWSSPGVRLSYTSEHESLALLEYFVHLDPGDVPTDLVLAIADVPESVTREQLNADDFPATWRDSAAPAELARIGDEFVQRAENCLLLVPSVLSSSEDNWLINPAHAEFIKIMIERIHPVSYDPRMFEGERRQRRN